MGNNVFLSKRNSMQQAQQIMQGSWEWKKTPVKLIWWNPLVNTVEETERIESTWVRILGLPLHLWSQTTFKAIGDRSGGWVETEEETMLWNHLKWARIRVIGDGHNTPKEIVVENGGVLFKLEIWVESPATSTVGKGAACPLPRRKSTRNCWSKGYTPANHSR